MMKPTIAEPPPTPRLRYRRDHLGLVTDIFFGFEIWSGTPHQRPGVTELTVDVQ